MVPTREEIRRCSLDDRSKHLDRFREVAGLSWREIGSCLGVADRRVAAWRKGRLPGGEAMYALIELLERVPGGLEVLYPEFAAGLADEGGESEAPWA